MSAISDICIKCAGHGHSEKGRSCKPCGGTGLVDPGAGISKDMMSKDARDDLRLWLRHGRIGTGRGYQAEVQRAREIEAKAAALTGKDGSAAS